MADDAAILAELGHIKDDTGAIKAQLKELNGTVRENCTSIAVLRATVITWNSLKFGAIIGGVVAVAAIMAKATGLF